MITSKSSKSELKQVNRLISTTLSSTSLKMSFIFQRDYLFHFSIKRKPPHANQKLITKIEKNEKNEVNKKNEYLNFLTAPVMEKSLENRKCLFFITVTNEAKLSMDAFLIFVSAFLDATSYFSI